MEIKDGSKRHIPFTDIYVGRYVFLLISLGILIILSALLDDTSQSHVFSLFLLIVLVAGIISVLQQKSFYITGLILLGLWIAASALTYIGESLRMGLAAVFISCVFFAFTAAAILVTLFRERKVTLDVIYGAIAVYFLAALAWTSAYQFLYLINPASFRVAAGDTLYFTDLYYFSFTAMTTTGFGDIVPASRIARALSLLEAVFGQLYIAVIIARLVGVHISHADGRH
jgi:hypothetical protein